MLWGALLAVIVHPRLPDSRLLENITRDVFHAVERAVQNGHADRVFNGDRSRYLAITKHVSDHLQTKNEAHMGGALATVHATLLPQGRSPFKIRVAQKFLINVNNLCGATVPASAFTYQRDRTSRSSTLSLAQRQSYGGV